MRESTREGRQPAPKTVFGGTMRQGLHGSALRRLPDGSAPGVADARLLPNDDFAAAWSAIVLPDGMKQRLLRTAVAEAHLRAAVPFDALPLHGVILLTGKPGVGKTTVARGLADRVARTVPNATEWLFVEVDPHSLASSSLGRSQRAVEQLFGTLLDEHAAAGPMVVLLDEVETLFTDRAALSMDANPVDVHRAVDAALVGLDRLARRHPQMLIVATTNFSDALDPALASRADWIVEVPPPDPAARRLILEHTIAAVAAAFPGAGSLLEPALLDAAAEAADGLDGRRLRKAVATACAYRQEAQGDPDRVTGGDLLAVLREKGGQR
ncbi:AAA family ATPase [Solwaraspora sp. WMMD792]|uniref:AAA family ATPase n=1 Tax=Solwaraspora sp. WMMD792 TaxID=3016099 RepID=UPI002417310C|nr:AAA family ATPase [Solwaraspora sp. WMMD792]MDG4769966.1 AAA family ATPase [Solwaraspora sp. WMMD792]